MPKGRFDVIRTSGDSGGLIPGEAITPYLRLQGQKAFKPGPVSVKVRADGNFTLKRNIRPGKAVTAYMSWKSTKSNSVRWRTVRG